MSPLRSAHAARPANGRHWVGTAIGEILPLAVALAVGPLPIIAIVLILVSDNAKAKGAGFVFGRVAGVALLVVVGMVVASLLNDPKMSSGGHPPTVASVARIVLGIALVALAGRKWHRRAEESKPSPVASRVDRLSVRGSVGMGLAVSVADPSCLFVAFLSGFDIAGARQPGMTDVIVVIVFVALATISVTVPLAGYLVGGQSARDRLMGAKGWLLANENAVMIVLFLLVGAMLVGRGIRDLAGV
jgi:hypothetical protein